MSTTLVITNDFPPSIGGIEAFVEQVCQLLGDVVVLTRSHPEGAAFDRGLPFPVHRRGRVLLPTPATRRTAIELMTRFGASRIVFGAAAPLGRLAGPLRAAGASRMLAISHGHETWWARLPVSRRVLHQIGDEVDAVSYISQFTRDAIAPALSDASSARMIRLAPPVDTARFLPVPKPERPTVVAAGRFIPQKGFDTLLQAWAGVLAEWSGAPPRLVLIGDGPQRRCLQARVARLADPETVCFSGPVPHVHMPAALAQGHVFALPVRTRWAGLNPEGLGMVFAEAAACGLAVVAGRSGGTADTLRSGHSGCLVDPDDPTGLADVLLTLLRDLRGARAMGEAGRRHVEEHFSPATTATVLRQVLDLPMNRR